MPLTPASVSGPLSPRDLRASLSRRDFVAAVSTLAFASLASGATDATGPIKIGHYASLTGKDAAFGVATRKGVLLAIEEINAKGGVSGRKLEYLVEDIQSKQGESATAVKKLISRDKVVAVIGANASANSLEAAPICQNAKIPMMAISSTNPAVTEKGDHIFRICFIDPFQGAVLAKFAFTSLKAKSIALLTSVNSPYSVGLSAVLRERFTALGGTVVAEQKHAEGDKDFRAQLTAIRTAKPDVIAATGFYSEAALICKRRRPWRGGPL
ncbi:MAG: ABC transporter substrate-binding protein [Verrucomicrobiota bacterium]